MLIYIFYIDDTLYNIDSYKQNNLYNTIEKNNKLVEQINNIDSPIYALTNATHEHGEFILSKLGIRDKFKHIFARDTIPYMKPSIESYTYVKKKIIEKERTDDITLLFFDDLLHNLEGAKQCDWRTVWINYNYNNNSNVDYQFQNINEALVYFERHSFNTFNYIKQSFF